MPARAADEPDARKIYAAKCASCHGDQGQGGKKKSSRLEGDKSILELTKLIWETMPDDDPGLLSEKEAHAVATYIHESFNSQVARERNKPARISLARLTIKQYRQSLADVIWGGRPPFKPGEKSGLRGEYFAGRRMDGKARVGDRLDPQVDFDFGTEAPTGLPEGKGDAKLQAPEFSMRWTGSIFAPETGEYELTIRTDHAGRLWVNEFNNNRPLVDAWVKSGTDTEHKAHIHLVGGRWYPLKLEFSKAKQGVDDSKKQKKPPPPVKAMVGLWWKPPHRPSQVVPGRFLCPEQAAEWFVSTVPFPPDDRSYGWERGTAISRAWEQATTEGALEAAGYVAQRINDLAGGRRDGGDRAEKARAYCRSLLERAWRRPISAEESARLVDAQFKDWDVETAVKRVVMLALKSPRFLYREVGDAPEPYHVASRLSFGLWDSIPDAELLKAAASGNLSTRQQVADQATRMLGDWRAKSKLRDFLLTWVKADQVHDLVKDAAAYPGFDATVAADLRTSLELFLEEVIASEASDFRNLLLSDEVYLNGRLAKFYGAELPVDAPFSKVKLDPGRRAGVLTHPYLMTSFSHDAESSPIHRGVFLARGVLGVSLRPPPEAVAPLAPSLHPSLTTRERVVMQTKANACMSCHSVINPLGFTLEHFDAIGRYREMDKNKPIDSTGAFRTREGTIIPVKNARELAEKLAQRVETHDAFVEQMFHHLVQQPVRAYGADRLQTLRKSLVDGGFNLRKLAVEVMAASALTPRADGATKAAAEGTPQQAGVKEARR